MKPALKELDYVTAAQMIGCSVAMIKAVCKVEAPKGGFFKNDRPTILFEPYWFGELTGHKYDNTVIQIDNVNYPLSLNRRKLPWSVKNAKYGASDIQYEKLEAAMKFDKDAAQKSCSWGKFQILGVDYKICGFKTLDEFVAAMYESERKHLFAFINFVKAKKLDDELQREDCLNFAIGYNGPKQDKGTVDEKDDYSYFLKVALDEYKRVA